MASFIAGIAIAVSSVAVGLGAQPAAAVPSGNAPPPSSTAFTNCPTGTLAPGDFEGVLDVTVSPGLLNAAWPRAAHVKKLQPDGFSPVSGTVDFTVTDGPDHVGSLGSGTLVNDSTSSDSIAFDEPGTYVITAQYEGSAAYSSSSATCMVDVMAPDVLSVSSSSPINSHTGNPTSAFGTHVTFTVTLDEPAETPPPPLIRSRDASPAVTTVCEETTLRPRAVPTGCTELYVADYDSAGDDFDQELSLVFDHTDPNTGDDIYTASQEFSQLPVGSHYVEADYYDGTQLEDNLTQDVVAPTPPYLRPTDTVITSSANPSAPGAPVTFSATVMPSDSGGGTPTGTVTFAVDGTNHPATLAGGTASFEDDLLSAGSHTVTATYNGDSTFAPSADDLTQQVGAATGGAHGLLFTEPGTAALGSIDTGGASSSRPLRAKSAPTALAIGGDSRVWVTETARNAIAAVDATGHETDYRLHKRAAPTSIVAGSDGRLWFTEPQRHRIGAITTAGHVTSFRLGHRADPTEITVGHHGKLWFTEPNRSRVGRIRTNGHHKVFKVRAGSRPLGIAEGPDGAIWFTEQAKRRIGRIHAGSPATDFKVARGSRPSAIVSGPDGNLWFTEPGRSRIGRITPAGVATDFAARRGGQPSAITVGPDHRLWFTEPGDSRIGAMTRLGTFSDYGVGAGTAPSDIISLS